MWCESRHVWCESRHVWCESRHVWCESRHVWCESRHVWCESRHVWCESRHLWCESRHVWCESRHVWCESRHVWCESRHVWCESRHVCLILSRDKISASVLRADGPANLTPMKNWQVCCGLKLMSDKRSQMSKSRVIIPRSYAFVQSKRKIEEHIVLPDWWLE